MFACYTETVPPPAKINSKRLSSLFTTEAYWRNKPDNTAARDITPGSHDHKMSFWAKARRRPAAICWRKRPSAPYAVTLHAPGRLLALEGSVLRVREAMSPGSIWGLIGRSSRGCPVWRLAGKFATGTPDADFYSPRRLWGRGTKRSRRR